MKSFYLTICFILAVPCFSIHGAGTWSAPIDISNPNIISEASALIDDNGSAVAIWKESAVLSGPATIQSNSAQADAVWGTPVQLTDVPTSNAGSPALGIDQAGNAVAIWVYGNDGSTILQAATKPLGQAWSAPINLASLDDDPLAPALAVDANGNATAIWGQFNGMVFSSTLPFGGSWTAPVGISVPSVDTQGNLRLEVDGTGNVTAAWNFFTNSGLNTAIATATLPFGGSWTPPLTAVNPPLSFTLNGFDLAVGENGHAIIAYEGLDSGTSEASIQVVRRSTSSSSWSSPIVVVSSTSAGFSNPLVEMDGNGNAVITWLSDGGGAIDSLYISTLLAGSSTPSVPLLLSPAGITVVDFALEMNMFGNTVAEWLLDNGIGQRTVQASTLPAGGTWTSAQTIFSGTLIFRLTLSINAPGNILAGWLNGDISKEQVAYGIGFFPVLPPTSLSGKTIKNRFATQTDWIHRLTWIPSPDLSVVGYHIYRNGLLIGIVSVNGPFVFDDHNRHPKIPDSYILKAFNTQGDESSGIGIVL